MTKEEIAVKEEAEAAALKQAEEDEKAAADKKAEEEANATEKRIKELEDERNKAIEEAANYKLGMLKAKSKKDSEDDEDETEEERVARLVAKELSDRKVEAIDKEKAELLEKTLRENTELKLAQLNKTKEPSAIQGGHSEGIDVRSTVVTPEQEKALRARGWTDKDLERYKKNLSRHI
jgi:hypothetical protein